MKLNLGSGNVRYEGFVNVDRVKLKNVDIAHDLNKLPYPFKSSSAEEIRMFHCLEHLKTEPLEVIEELYRILKPGGILILRLPYPAHPVAHNMWHRHTFQAKDFYVLNKEHHLHHYIDMDIDVNFKVKKIRYIPNITYLLFPFWLLERLFLFLANSNPRIYEAYWSQLFPISEFEVTLIKLEQ